MASSGSLQSVIDVLCSPTDISDCGFLNLYPMSSPSTNVIAPKIIITDTHTNAMMMTSILEVGFIILFC